ncbi:MAG: hypothetical protein IJ647_04885 [Prevotella sp.]|nr:hypothetical protein [Prevotella sp.]
MSNEVVDLKLNGTGGEATKPTQPEVQEQENIEGSYRYDSLKDADVNNLVSDSRPTLITLFGVSECGKTTFVGSLFAILRRRPCLLKKTFIDSDTLTGFERRVHQRFLSEDGQSVIQRTQRKAGSILNVVLGNEQGNNQHMFVISDLSGEIYWDAISDITIVQQQKAVKYADKLVIFADIEPLLKAKSYNSYKENFQSLLARFKENDMLPVGAEVYVALNKSDMVESAAINASKTETDEVDEEKKKAFIKAVDKRKKAIVEIVKDSIAISDDHLFEISSLGIQVGEENGQLIKLFSELLCKKEQKPLPASYNWIQTVSKN